MSGNGKVIPASGSKADEDLTPEFTYEDWTRDMLADLGDVAPPSRAEGWIPFTDLLLNAKNINKTQLRDALEKKVLSGEYERVYYQKRVYYRKIDQTVIKEGWIRD